MNLPSPATLPPSSECHVLAERRGPLGLLTLNRPSALNALSLDMVRALTQAFLAWRDDPAVALVCVQGACRPGKAPAFCAGGDIRFFHQAALAGDPRLEDFFTEEYALNHLIHHYPKPCVALMDGICMGGGMGLSQGARLRVVTEHSQLAMPETLIGLFPDVGGGWFLSRCPGHLGEYLGVSGQVLGPEDAIEAGLADLLVPARCLPDVVASLATLGAPTPEQVVTTVTAWATPAAPAPLAEHRANIDVHFSQPNLPEVLASLAADGSDWACATAATLAKRSPLMMAVTLAQVRRARQLSLADDLRMERDLVRRCFQPRPGLASETDEGIRALVIDKDHRPRWQPAAVEALSEAQVAAFFDSPWPAWAHPLRHLD